MKYASQMSISLIYFSEQMNTQADREEKDNRK